LTVSRIDDGFSALQKMDFVPDWSLACASIYMAQDN
jgi:hypothetical protein